MLESPASTLALRNQLRLSRPGSYYFSAGGGLGFGLSASVGVQLAQPDRPVVCVIGEGSVQYAVTAFWSAVAYEVPVTFLVLRNSEYAILKWFAEVESVHGRARPRPARARRRRGRRRLRRQRAARRAAATRCATRWPRRSPPRGRSWSKSRSRRGCPSSRASDGAAGAEIARSRRASEPAADRAPDALAGGTAQPLRGELEALLGADRVLAPGQRHRPLRLRRQPLPAAAAGGGDGARRRATSPRSSPTAAPTAIPVVFRAGGTSLNGQGQSDGILVDVRRHFGGVAVEEDGALARVKPGTVLGHANRVLAPHGRKLGPDPASTDIATVGGVIANNSGGMRCGIDPGLLLDGALADLRPALGDDDRHRRARMPPSASPPPSRSWPPASPRSATRSAPTPS